MTIGRLSTRGVISVSGADAPSFLQGLVTSDVESMADGASGFAALLTPQGKILFDFIVHRRGDAFLIDLPLPACAGFAKRMTLYKLRSAVEVSDISETFAVVVSAETDQLPPDPRLAALGGRSVVPISDAPSNDETANYEARRISLGIAETWNDFASGEVFPHEANFDLINGVSQSKGCYVGQEVVSRMQHRGTARKRFLPCRLALGEDALPPEVGAAVSLGDRGVGIMGSANAAQGLALLRLDRIADALAGKTPLTSEGSTLWPHIPPGATDVIGADEAGAE